MRKPRQAAGAAGEQGEAPGGNDKPFVPPVPAEGGSYTYDRDGRLIAEEHAVPLHDPRHPAHRKRES